RTPTPLLPSLEGSEADPEGERELGLREPRLLPDTSHVDVRENVLARMSHPSPRLVPLRVGERVLEPGKDVPRHLATCHADHLPFFASVATIARQRFSMPFFSAADDPASSP